MPELLSIPWRVALLLQKAEGKVCEEARVEGEGDVDEELFAVVGLRECVQPVEEVAEGSEGREGGLR